ncbi:MAG: hypothetical protein WC761_01640 [Candidatus Paceibacterota bacterium]|jgi:hypothetical protein
MKNAATKESLFLVIYSDDGVKLWTCVKAATLDGAQARLRREMSRQRGREIVILDVSVW